MKKIFFMVMVMTLALPALSFATNPIEDSSDEVDSGLVVCDLNNDGARNISDVALYAGCVNTFDVNNDGIHDLTDATLYSANYTSSSWCKTNFKCTPNNVNTTTNDSGLNVCDINNDGVRNLSDVSLFAGCVNTFDVNNDGIHDLTDTSLYSANSQSSSWCRTNFRCAPTITDYSELLEIIRSSTFNTSDNVVRVNWAASVGSMGQYRYTKNQSELANLPWREDGVSNNPEVTGSFTGSQVDLSGLEAGVTYYIQVRKYLGTQYGVAKILTFMPGNTGEYSNTLDIAIARVDQLTKNSARVYWKAVNMSGNGYYRYAQNEDDLAGLPWISTGVSNDPYVTGNMNASMVTLNNLQSGTEYHIELKKTVGIAGESGYKYGASKIIDFKTLGEGDIVVDPVSKIKVCHVLGNGRSNTLEVAADAVAAHTAHGDKLGECNEGEDDDVRPVVPVSAKLVERVRGRILLQVESHGEAWYVNPKDDKRFYLKDGSTAYSLMREAGLGITNADLAKIPVGFEDRFNDTDSDDDGLADKLESGLGTDPSEADTDSDGIKDKDEILARSNPLGAGKLSSDSSLANRLRGRIVLQVESRGEAWYIDPSDGKRYYMRDGEAAYQIMRFRSLGITNSDLAKIAE